ncbi:MAG: LPS export ABC transporter periplasmic protein LptC [Bacteroidota bacterium]
MIPKRFHILVILFLFAFLWASCTEEKTIESFEVYDGPLVEADNLVMYYSDSAIVTTKAVAARSLEFADGDREFPEGIHLEFYDLEGNTTSTIEANTAKFLKEENKWHAIGNVIVNNIENQERLNTEELFWYPQEQRISTEKKVSITLANKVIFGKGLEADQNFETYEIKNPTGEFDIEQ